MPNDARPSLATLTTRFPVRRTLAWVVGVILAFAAIGFLALPLLLKPVLEDRLSTALARKVSIESLKFNPFAISATLGNVSVGERGEGPPMLTIGELYINGEMASLLRWAPVVSALRVTRPALNLVRNADKTYNISDLIDQVLAPGPTPRFSVSNIEIHDGRIDFNDQPERQRHAVTALELGIPFLSSLPTQTEIKVAPTFSALVNGRPVAITGETRPFADTHQTALHWDLAGLSLPRYLEYLPVTLPVQVTDGKLDATLDLSFIGRGSNPPELTLAGSGRLTELVVNERSAEPLLRVPSLDIVIDRLDLIGGNAELRSVAVDGAQLEVRRAIGGELNLASLLPPDSSPATGSSPSRFHIASVAFNRGTVHVTDEAVSPALVATLNDVKVDITNLGNAADQKSAVTIAFVTDQGEHFSHRGTLGLKPLAADGHMEVTGVKLARLLPYYGGAVNRAIDEGTMDLATDVQLAGTPPSLTLTNLDATMRDLITRLPDQKEPLWRVPTLAVRGGSVDPAKRVIQFDVLEGRGWSAAIRRDAEGRFNFARLVRTPAGGVRPTDDTEAWRVEARKVTFDAFAATFTDETVTPPAHISVARVSVAGENLSNAANAKGRAKLQATVGKHGSLTLSGPLSTAPFSATLNVVAKDIDLVPFQPYITQAARVVTTAGTASARGNLDVATGVQLRAGFKGDVAFADVAVLDEENATDLLKWKNLSLASVDARLEPLAVSIGEIALDEFFTRLILNESGEFNLQQLARARAPAAAPPAPAGPKTVELATPPSTATTWLKLGKATLSNGNIDFTDHFIRPNYSANLTGVTGSLSSLAFDQPADMELRAKVQDSAPVTIQGRINPLASNLFLDLKAEASDVELPPLTPYSGKYVGYGIEKGKLSMKVHYLVDNRKLTAENSVILDQLTFGDKIESPDATKLPVHLAVALLKDRNGVINFDLPISGSLDDPQFSVGGIVLRAIVSLIVKIVTSPFALLGSLAGHHSEELAYIEFAPGSAALDTAAEGKVDSIGKALVDRPGLKLDIAGRVDPAADRDGLKRAALDRKIRAQKFNDLVRAGAPPASPDAVQITPSEYAPLLVRVYGAADFPKPRNAIGIAKDLPREEMETLILTNTTVSEEDLHLLAEHRAQIVHDRLVDTAHVPGERVFVVAPHLDGEGIKDKGKATRVDFALR
jgi:uncharacterized protein involved in outer membrane biogenesis